MKSDRPLYFINKRQYNKNYTDCYRLDFTSTHASQKLAEVGCGQSKSLTLRFPSIVPHNFIRHFVRGYFDGDGCICYSETKRGYFHGIISFVGTSDFCEHLQKILNEWNINAQITIDKRASERIRILSFGGRNQIIKLYNYLYNNSSIFFDRKKLTFDTFIKISREYLVENKPDNVYKNVRGCKLPFRVVKTLNYKTISLGAFKSRDEAIKASVEWDKSNGRFIPSHSSTSVD
jgi:intein/homing endonuclease